MSMSKITVKIEKDFTVIPNEIIRNKDMSANAKMILITMLSLPPEWDFSVNGLTSIVKEGKDTVRSALIEIEKFGYLTRKRERKADGTLKGVMYTVYQYPVDKNLRTYKPKEDKPKLEKPTLDKPIMDNQSQYNTELELNTNNNLESNKLSKDVLSNKEVNTSDVSDVRVNTFPTGKGESKKLTRKQLEEKQSDMIKRFNNICDDNLPANPIIKDCVKKVFARYIIEYNNHTDKIHPILKDETLLRIALIFAGAESKENSLLSEIETYTPYDGTTMFDDMVDLHFLRKHRQETDWSIVHFANAEYLDKLASGLI